MSNVHPGSVYEVIRDVEDQMDMEENDRERFFEIKNTQLSNLQGNLEGWLTKFRNEIDIVMPNKPDAATALRPLYITLKGLSEKN